MSNLLFVDCCLLQPPDLGFSFLFNDTALKGDAHFWYILWQYSYIKILSLLYILFH